MDAEPPEYPAVVEITPLTRSRPIGCPEAAAGKNCGLLSLARARGLSLAEGIGDLAAALQPVQAAKAITRATKVLRIAKELNTDLRPVLRRTYATEVTSDTKYLTFSIRQSSRPSYW